MGCPGQTRHLLPPCGHTLPRLRRFFQSIANRLALRQRHHARRPRRRRRHSVFRRPPAEQGRHARRHRLQIGQMLAPAPQSLRFFARRNRFFPRITYRRFHLIRRSAPSGKEICRLFGKPAVLSKPTRAATSRARAASTNSKSRSPTGKKRWTAKTLSKSTCATTSPNSAAKTNAPDCVPRWASEY